MKKRRRREIEVFSLSFLDVVSCGFGAIILLLVISQFSEPRVVEQISRDMTAQVQKLEDKKKEIQGQSRVINRELISKREQLSKLKEKVARLQAELRKIQGRFAAARTDQEAQEIIAKQLETAREKLTDEMKRLQERQPVRPPKPDAVIGGIPVDSEYIIFVIDTSGSMQRFAWPLVRKKMNEILRIYPHVKGIQVMNDMGDYMFSQYAGRWIPDSPARRRAILSRLVTWAPFSNSSPVEGVERAIRNFYSPDKNISIYILGDDFSKGSIQAVVDTVNQLNRSGSGGRRRVRIHAIGFPVLIKEAPGSANIERFAALMRRLAEDNNGSFVGLSGLR
jgi:hypothetical protein